VKKILLALPLVLAALPAHAAGFDCAKARSPDEKAVCASRPLSEMDVEMSVRFSTLTGLVAMGARGDMQDEQLTFLSERRNCRADKRCLTSLYKARIAVLKRQYARLKSRGPF
jgi:uncharacterized protein